MAAHDLRQLGSVRETTRGCVDYLGRFTEILRPDCSWRNHAECLYVLASVVIEAMNGPARNAECLPRPDIDLPSVDRPGRDSVYAVNHLFVMVVAMGRSCQALCAGDKELKCRDAAV